MHAGTWDYLLLTRQTKIPFIAQSRHLLFCFAFISFAAHRRVGSGWHFPKASSCIIVRIHALISATIWQTTRAPPSLNAWHLLIKWMLHCFLSNTLNLLWTRQHTQFFFLIQQRWHGLFQSKPKSHAKFGIHETFTFMQSAVHNFQAVTPPRCEVMHKLNQRQSRKQKDMPEKKRLQFGKGVNLKACEPDSLDYYARDTNKHCPGQLTFWL